MHIVVIGGNGQVGWEIQRALAPLGTCAVLTRSESQKCCVDLGQPEALGEIILSLRPNVIVNAAAYTAVDSAEAQPEKAALANASALRVLAAKAKYLGAWLVHYSTDYVFDGTGRGPWQESDPTGPLNVYGQTKLDGERAIQQSGCCHLIFRTSWVYACRRENFLRTMLRRSAERDSLQVIDDQYGAPTSAELIADTTALALRQCLAQEQDGGLYHLAARGETTWFGYARHVIRTARALGWPVRVADEAIQPVSSDAFPTAAKRPRNSRLDTSRLESTFGLRMPDWQIGVDRAVKEILSCEIPEKNT